MDKKCIFEICFVEELKDWKWGGWGGLGVIIWFLDVVILSDDVG